MKYIILMSHGSLASGLLSSLEIITGKLDYVYAIDMYIDNEKLESKLERLIKENKIDLDETVIFTDIIGGSVNQEIINYVNLNNTFIIAGMNLPLLLSIVTTNLYEITSESLEKLVELNREQIQLVNKILDNSEDDFDI